MRLYYMTLQVYILRDIVINSRSITGSTIACNIHVVGSPRSEPRLSRTSERQPEHIPTPSLCCTPEVSHSAATW